MTWGDALSAKLTRLWAFVSLGFGRKSLLKDGTNTCPTAATMRQTRLPVETPSLALRAHRLHNRDTIKAALYLEKHETLAKGACSDG